MWLDNEEDGNARVAFVTGHNRSQGDVTQRSRLEADEFKIVTVTNSLNELEQIQDQIDEDFSDLGRDGVELSYWSVHEPSNRVLLGVTDLTEAEKGRLLERYGSDRVNVVDAPRAVEDHDAQPCNGSRSSCLPPNGHPWRGALKVIRNGTTSYCTSGFWVRDNNYTGSYFLTAGHCVPQGTKPSLEPRWSYVGSHNQQREEFQSRWCSDRRSDRQREWQQLRIPLIVAVQPEGQRLLHRLQRGGRHDPMLPGGSFESRKLRPGGQRQRLG